MHRAAPEWLIDCGPRLVPLYDSGEFRNDSMCNPHGQVSVWCRCLGGWICRLACKRRPITEMQVVYVEGPLVWGSQCLMSIFGKRHCHASLPFISPNVAHMSNLRKDYVQCHYIFTSMSHVIKPYMPYVEFKKGPCRLVDFRSQGPLLGVGYS